jgi:hypothetical protein
MNQNEINKRIAIYRAKNAPQDWAWNGGDPSNYYGDLNAMHEVLDTLKDSPLWDEYEKQLREICGAPSWYEGAGKEILHATAAQQAEAFLRTIGQWEGANTGHSPNTKATSTSDTTCEILTCEDCGKKGKSPEVFETTCPYAEEVHSTIVKVVLCDKCFQDALADI